MLPGWVTLPGIKIHTQADQPNFLKIKLVSVWVSRFHDQSSDCLYGMPVNPVCKNPPTLVEGVPATGVMSFQQNEIQGMFSQVVVRQSIWLASIHIG
jgi:hypothetical protein